jgi:hypothetical protein
MVLPHEGPIGFTLSLLLSLLLIIPMALCTVFGLVFAAALLLVGFCQLLLEMLVKLKKFIVRD